MNLDVLLIKRPGAVVAQVLQVDIAAQGRTMEEAKDRLRRAIFAELGERDCFRLPPAPKSMWTMFVQEGRIESQRVRLWRPGKEGVLEYREEGGRRAYRVSVWASYVVVEES